MTQCPCGSHSDTVPPPPPGGGPAQLVGPRPSSRGKGPQTLRPGPHPLMGGASQGDTGPWAFTVAQCPPPPPGVRPAQLLAPSTSYRVKVPQTVRPVPHALTALLWQWHQNCTDRTECRGGLHMPQPQQGTAAGLVHPPQPWYNLHKTPHSNEQQQPGKWTF